MTKLASYLQGNGDICCLLKQLTRWGLILSWLSTAGLDPKATTVAIAIAYTPQSFTPFCFWQCIILIDGFALVHANNFCTICNESWSRKLKGESYTLTWFSSQLMVVATIQCCHSLQKITWSLFCNSDFVTVVAFSWSSVDWSPFKLSNCDFNSCCAKLISRSVNLFPIMICSASNSRHCSWLCG